MQIGSSREPARPFVLLETRQPAPTDTPENSDREPLWVKTLKTKEEIRAHQELWHGPGTRDSDLDLFLYFADVRPEVIEAQVFVAYRGRTPKAVLMARREVQAIPLRLGFLNLRTPRLRVLDVIYGGLRGTINEDTTEVLVREVLKSLRAGEADVAIFEPLKTDSGLWDVLRSLPSRLGRGFAGPQHNHYRMSLPRSSHELQELIPSNQRRDYLRKGRKLVRDFSGNVSWRWYGEPSAEMYRDLEYIAERSYQRALGVGFQDTAELRGYWDLVASKGWLRVCVLYASGTPCAFWTGVACCGILWCDYLAYNQKFASYSPGMYLVLQSFGDLCDTCMQHGIREISLGPGDSRLKSLLGCSCEQEKSVYLYADTAMGAALNGILSCVFALDAAAKKWLGESNPIARTARRIRRRHAIRSLAF
jgi:Acetyltransferase (GNAT) domain